MKRWLKRILLLLVLLSAATLVIFGIFKHSEHRVIEKSQEYLEKGEPHEALRIFKDFENIYLHRWYLKYDLEDPLWHYHYGLALLGTSDYANAASKFDRAALGLKGNKEKALAYFNLGEARLWQWGGGAFEEAAMFYQEALKSDSELVIAKKRLEWLRLANLIKGEMAGDPKGKGEGQPGNKKEREGEEDKEKFKQTEGKRRKGY